MAGTLSVDCRCLSVRLSVCPVLDPKSTVEGLSKLKVGRKEDHDTGNSSPHLEVERSKVKVTRLINAVTKNAPYLPKGRPTNFRLGSGME